MYVANRRSKAAREGGKKPFGGSEMFGVAPVGNKQPEHQDDPKMSHQIQDSLEGYLDNITEEATQKSATGIPLG